MLLKSSLVSSWPSCALLMQHLLHGPPSVGEMLEVNQKLRLPPFPYFIYTHTYIAYVLFIYDTWFEEGKPRYTKNAEPNISL